jgi:hypothetical protein
MRPEKFSAILDEVNSKRQQQSLAILMALVLGGVGLFGGFAIGGVWPVMMLLALPGWMIGFWLDSYLRTVVLFYELEGEVEEVYKVLIASFDRLISCEAIWHVEAGGAVRDLTTWKRNAGASHIIKKKPTILTFKLPVLINCNITPPAAHVGRQVLYFLPDVVLIDDQGRIGAIDYSMLKIHWQDSNFIEDGSVPRDAEVIGHTWRYPNKSGGPDRRFNNNYQIPVCRYEVMHLKSDSGLNELIEFSKTGVVQTFASSVELLAQERAGSIKKSIGVNQPQSST